MLNLRKGKISFNEYETFHTCLYGLNIDAIDPTYLKTRMGSPPRLMDPTVLLNSSYSLEMGPMSLLLFDEYFLGIGTYYLN